ncbi:MAG: MASE3 domain-containing protein [Desulfobacterales bacterium]
MTTRRPVPYTLGALLMGGLLLAGWHSYLLFHSLAEIFSIVVSFSIFLFAWNTMAFSRDRFLIVLGTAYLFVAALDLSHMLVYKGMGILAVEGADHATQAWIAARYMESISLLLVPFLFHRRVNPHVVIALYGAISLVLFALIFPLDLFPQCYNEGVGLTPFKIISEYVICLILLAAGIVLYLRRAAVDPVMFRLLLASIGFTIASEIAFTNYVSVYGPANMIGHLLKIVSSYLVYRAIVAHGLLAPYKSMFRELAASKNELEQYSQSLESCVADRTRALEESNRELRYLSGQLVNAEQKERSRIARDLHDSIAQSLSAIKLYMENIISKKGDQLGKEDLATLEKIASMSREATREVRRIIMDLRPAALDEGIAATIDSLRQKFNGMYPEIRVEKHVSVKEDQVPGDVKIVIFRLLQESLNNIGKHSNARHVNVVLSGEGGRIRFEVTDDGKGFDPEAEKYGKAGFGLAGMRERAELSGAQFYLRSRSGAGTSVIVIWPAESASARAISAG